jgi:hypothetical protein
MLKLKQIGSNQTSLRFPKGEVFFSYETPVAARIYNRDIEKVATKEKFSRTTSRHVNAWLGRGEYEEVEAKSFDDILREVMK